MEYYAFTTPYTKTKPPIEVKGVQDMFNKLWDLSTNPTNDGGHKDVSGVLNGCRVTIQWIYIPQEDNGSEK